jgi:chromosomal replication initiator protein
MDHNSWHCVLEELKNLVSTTDFSNYLQDSKYLKEDDSVLYIQSNLPVTMNYCNTNLSSLCSEVIKKLYNKEYKVNFILESKVKPVLVNEDSVLSVLKKHNLDPLLSFKEYIPGTTYKVAYETAKAVADNPGMDYNPLFLYGSSGLGKTHLMQAVAQYMINKNIHSKINYLTAQQFTDIFFKHIKNLESLKSKYGSLDILLIDDIHSIKGDQGLQTFFHEIFDVLIKNKVQIITTADRPVKEIKTLIDSVVSRFNKGWTFEILQPNYETRYAILQHKLKKFKLVLNESVMTFIVERVTSDVRNIEGSLLNIQSHCSALNIKSVHLSVDDVYDIIKDKINPYSVNFDIKHVFNKMCEYFNIAPVDMTAKTRVGDIPYKRKIAMYITNKLLPNLSQQIIAEYYNKKDHSIVSKIFKELNSKLENDVEFKLEYDRIVRFVRG